MCRCAACAEVLFDFFKNGEKNKNVQLLMQRIYESAQNEHYTTCTFYRTVTYLYSLLCTKLHKKFRSCTFFREQPGRSHPCFGKHYKKNCGKFLLLRIFTVKGWNVSTGRFTATKYWKMRPFGSSSASPFYPLLCKLNKKEHLARALCWYQVFFICRMRYLIPFCFCWEVAGSVG